MSSISRDDVVRIADLARIHLSEAEIDAYRDDLDTILDSLDQLQRAVSDDVVPTSHPVPLTNVMRKDEVADVLDRDSFLASAPQAEDGQFAVPQILGEE